MFFVNNFKTINYLSIPTPTTIVFNKRVSVITKIVVALLIIVFI